MKITTGKEIEREIKWLATKYSKYGWDYSRVLKLLFDMAFTAPETHRDLTSLFLGARFALSQEYGEPEAFTLTEVAAIIGTTQDEALEIMNQSGVSTHRIITNIEQEDEA